MLHKRSPTVQAVELAELRVEEFREHDPHGMRLIKQDILGKIAVAVTRVDVAAIVRGFFRQQDGRVEHFTQLSERGVVVTMDYIRGGARPSVEVYWSPIAPPSGSYVCSDSEAVYEAYVRLGFKSIPVRILKPKATPQKEGAIWLQRSGNVLKIVKAVQPAPVQNVGIYRVEGQGVRETLQYLIEICKESAADIRRFHLDRSDKLHYHQMMHAVACRHARFLDSAKQMIEQNRLEHAALIARTCYESYLNFNLDWLAPEVVGPRLQLLAASWVSDYDVRKSGVLSNFIELFENAKSKARLSSLGLPLYQKFYPAVSRMVHQSYIYVEREASNFEETVDEADSVESLVNCLSIITAALIPRIINDVGQGSSITPS